MSTLLQHCKSGRFWKNGQKTCKLKYNYVLYIMNVKIFISCKNLIKTLCKNNKQGNIYYIECGCENCRGISKHGQLKDI